MTTRGSFPNPADRSDAWPRWSLWALVAVVAILAASVAAALLSHASPVGGPEFPFWPVFPFGFSLVVATVFLVFRALGGGGCWWGYRHWREPSARELVRERYARGEIDAEQMRRMLRDLAGPSGEP